MSAPPRSDHQRRSTGFLLLGLAVALLLAGVLSYYASSDPDGLEKVASDHSLDANAQDSHTAGSPFADYGVAGVENERLSVGLAGALGVGVTFLVTAGVFLLVRRREPTAPGGPAGPTAPVEPLEQLEQH